MRLDHYGNPLLHASKMADVYLSATEVLVSFLVTLYPGHYSTARLGVTAMYAHM